MGCGREEAKSPARKTLWEPSTEIMWPEHTALERHTCSPGILRKHNKSRGDWLDVGNGEGARQGKGDKVTSRTLA